MYVHSRVCKIVWAFCWQRNAFAADVLPVESYIDSLLAADINSLGTSQPFTLKASLKHVLQALLKFCQDLIM